jgi:hypothetical protein
MQLQAFTLNLRNERKRERGPKMKAEFATIQIGCEARKIGSIVDWEFEGSANFVNLSNWMSILPAAGKKENILIFLLGNINNSGKIVRCC